VVAALWAPFAIPADGEGSGCWGCYWKIEGTVHDQRKAMFGEDAFQALELALKLIESILTDISFKNLGKLLWGEQPYKEEQKSLDKAPTEPTTGEGIYLSFLKSSIDLTVV
jgi:hypothetical protein